MEFSLPELFGGLTILSIAILLALSTCARGSRSLQHRRQLALAKKKPGPTAMPVRKVDNAPEPVGPNASLAPNLPCPGL